LLDIAYQLSVAPAVAEGLKTGDDTELCRLAALTENCENCSGLALLDSSFKIYYNSSENGIDNAVLTSYRDSFSAGEKRYDIVADKNGEDAIFAICPVYDTDGTIVGGILAKLQHPQNHEGLQKVQRDLNAMTVLVLIIAMIFVWDLTDHIKGTMFNLEPVEIAQLLVERNALIDAVRDGILSVNRSGHITHANSTALQLFEHSMQPFNSITSVFSDIFPHVPFEEILQGNHPIYDTECLIGADSFYANFIPIKIETPQHESVLVTFRAKREVVRFAEDITGVKSYVEALQAQMHEFNNKLQVVSGLVQSQNYPELEDYVHALIHLKNREMLQINSKVKNPILAAFLMSKFDRAAEQKVDLILTERTDLRDNLPQSLLQDLVVIIGNLLENAFDAVQGCAMRTVTLEIVGTSGEICVSVWDSGIAIPEEVREELFDYGVTTKPDGKGIGMFLVRQSCSRYNGYIKVVSEPQDGTEFVVHIPFLKEQEVEHVPSTDC
ncbi:MAG: ATP-binding protein, partial [Pygmaiobacter sp.]